MHNKQMWYAESRFVEAASPRLTPNPVKSQGGLMARTARVHAQMEPLTHTLLQKLDVGRPNAGIMQIGALLSHNQTCTQLHHRRHPACSPVCCTSIKALLPPQYCKLSDINRTRCVLTSNTMTVYQVLWTQDNSQLSTFGWRLLLGSLWL
jgi:hypothetical protein